jgi:hypothetical protein
VDDLANDVKASGQALASKDHPKISHDPRRSVDAVVFRRLV